VIKGAQAQTGAQIRSCVETAADNTTKALCKGSAKAALAQALGKPAPSLRRTEDSVSDTDVEEFTQKATRDEVSQIMAACMEAAGDQAARTACKATDAKVAIANTQGKPTSTVTDIELERFVREAAIDTMAEESTACYNAGETVTNCDALVKSKFAEKLGWTAGEVTPSDMKMFRVRGGKMAVKRKMSACSKSASSSGLSVCKSEAKASLAKALGKTVDTVTAADVEDQARQGAKDDVGSIMSSCIIYAGTDTAKKAACKTGPAKSAVKDALAEIDVSTVEVDQYIDAGATVRVADSMEDCMTAASNDTAKVSACAAFVAGRLAAALGKDGSAVQLTDPTAAAAGNINKATLQQVIRKAAGRRVREKMAACLDAGLQASACAVQAKDMTKMMLGKTSMPTVMEEAMIKKNGAAEGGAEKMKACMASATSDAEKEMCQASVKAQVIKMMGGTLNAFDFEDIKMKGAADASSEYSEACAKSTCSDADFKRNFQDAEGRVSLNTATSTKGKTEAAQAKRDGAKALVRKARMGCKDVGGDAATVAACVSNQVSAVYSKVAKSATEKVDKRSAIAEEVQEEIVACVNSGTSADTCQASAITTVGGEATVEEVKDYLLKGRSDGFKIAFQCTSSDEEQCKTSAAARASMLGGKASEKKGDEKFNAMRSAANRHADCSVGNNAQGATAECETEAKEEFKKMGGSDEEWAVKSDAVIRLSQAHQEGDLTQIVRNASAELLFCDSTACTADKKSTYSTMAASKAAEQGGTVGVQVQQSASGSSGCCTQFVISLPGKTDSQIETAASAMAVAGRRTSYTTYASQTVTECPSAGCNTAITLPPPPPPPTPPSPGSATVSRDMTFNKLSIADWSGDTKEVYECGFGISIGIYDEIAKAYESGCSVTSIANRRSITVAFKAQVSAALANVAKQSATTLSAAVLASSIQSANTALSKTVAVPSATDIEVLALPTYQNSGSGTNWTLVAVLLTLGVLSVFCIAIWGYIAYRCVASGPSKHEAARLKTEELENEQVAIQRNELHDDTTGEQSSSIGIQPQSQTLEIEIERD